jgi:hypothetical protein
MWYTCYEYGYLVVGGACAVVAFMWAEISEI